MGTFFVGRLEMVDADEGFGMEWSRLRIIADRCLRVRINKTTYPSTPRWSYNKPFAKSIAINSCLSFIETGAKWLKLSFKKWKSFSRITHAAAKK